MDKFILKPAPTTEVAKIALPADAGAKLKQLVRDETLQATLILAMAFTKTVVSTTAMHVSGPFHMPESIKEKMHDDADATMHAGATLQDIALEVDALSTIDIARVQWMLTAHADSRSFKDSIGVISVNYDTVDEHVKQGRRLDKDAEIHALCLLIYWTEAQPFIDIASDLVIKYVHAGCGSSGKAYTLKLINLEESKRKVRIASMILETNFVSMVL